MADGDDPSARLARLHDRLKRLVREGAGVNANMRFRAAEGWTEDQLECFWRNCDGAALQGIVDAVEVALDQPNKTDHARAIDMLERELARLASTMDFRKYQAAGGKAH